MKKKVKVFTIEDSPVFREILKKIINSSSSCEFLGHAVNGIVAIDKLKAIKPDVITLDVEMPEMDGIETLRYIMKNCPIPVIMISAYTEHGADITLQALESGAVDYIKKPETINSQESYNELKDQIISKIILFADFKFPQSKLFKEELVEDGLPVIGGLPSYDIPKGKKKPIDIICIGASTGGTVALTTLLSNINRNIGIPIVIAQHMPKLYTARFADRLNTTTPLEVVEAKQGEKIKDNTVYIAPGGFNIRIENKKVILSDNVNESIYKPSVDILFTSIKEDYQSRVMGIILTGMGTDGTNGVLSISEAGGFAIAQDEATSVIFGMPGSAIKTGKINRIIPIDKIGQFINEYIKYNN